MKISIIIPVLNEGKALLKNYSFLMKLKFSLDAELIIIDGGSSDNTVKIAKSLTDKVSVINSSRSKQLNLGAKNSTGEYLMFLHVDTVINDSAISSLNKITSEFKWGFLKVKLDSNELKYFILSGLINLRSSLFNYATGDQVIIVNHSIFHDENGFKKIDIMEDVEFTNRLKKLYRPEVIDGRAITSIRRWKEYGFIKTILLMRTLRVLYHCGVNPKRLAKVYK